MPPHFSATYTPIAAAGTRGQIRHVARLMASQLTAANLGPGMKLTKKTQKLASVEDEEDVVFVPAKTTIATVISGRF